MDAGGDILTKAAAHAYKSKHEDNPSIEEAFMDGARWAFAFQGKTNWNCRDVISTEFWRQRSTWAWKTVMGIPSPTPLI